MMNFDGPLFIIGMPRSGTKLIRNILRRHPRIRISGAETEFFPWLVRVVARSGDLSRRERFARFYDDIVQLPHFVYKRSNGTLIPCERWFDACRTFDAEDIFESLVREEVGAYRGSGLIWGDKSPSYISEIPLLHRSFSSARFIHIVRDVRDYTLSMQYAWGKDILRSAQRWTDSVRRARQDGLDVRPNYTEIRYEDLLRNPEGELRKICEFLEIDFVVEIIDLDRPSESTGDARGQSRLVRENYGKYLAKMDRDLLKRVEAVAGRVLVECGYDLFFVVQKEQRVTRIEMMAAQIRDALSRLLLERKKRGLVPGFRFVWSYFRMTKHK